MKIVLQSILVAILFLFIGLLYMLIFSYAGEHSLFSEYTILSKSLIFITTIFLLNFFIKIKINEGFFKIDTKLLIFSVIAIFLSLGINSPMTGIPFFEEEHFDQTHKLDINNIITSILLVPFFEELIFKKYILERLLNIYSPMISIIITSVIFSLIHFDIRIFVPLFILSVITSYVYYTNRNIYESMILHSIYNAFSLISIYLSYFINKDSKNVELYYGNNTYIIMILSTIMIISFIGFYYKRYIVSSSKK